MKKTNKPRRKDDMLPEYDFKNGVRGKYAKRYASGTNLIILSPDLARLFPDSRSVNKALRSLIRTHRKHAA